MHTWCSSWATLQWSFLPHEAEFVASVELFEAGLIVMSGGTIQWDVVERSLTIINEWCSPESPFELEPIAATKIIRVITAIFLSQTLEAASNDVDVMIQERMRKKNILVEQLQGAPPQQQKPQNARGTREVLRL